MKKAAFFNRVFSTLTQRLSPIIPQHLTSTTTPRYSIQPITRSFTARIPRTMVSSITITPNILIKSRFSIPSPMTQSQFMTSQKTFPNSLSPPQSTQLRTMFYSKGKPWTGKYPIWFWIPVFFIILISIPPLLVSLDNYGYGWMQKAIKFFFK